LIQWAPAAAAVASTDTALVSTLTRRRRRRADVLLAAVHVLVDLPSGTYSSTFTASTSCRTTRSVDGDWRSWCEADTCGVGTPVTCVSSAARRLISPSTCQAVVILLQADPLALASNVF